jgi:hypothetical protein
MMLAGVCVLAGAVISLAPIGPCNHSPWQLACGLVLLPSIAAASCFFDTNSWGFQRMMFVTGSVQAGVIIGLYYLVASIMKRPNKGAAPNGGPATQPGNSGVTEGAPSVS